MSEQPFNAPRLLGADGQSAPPSARAVRATSGCPQCLAGRDKRTLGGFGAPFVICSACGYQYEGETEP